MDVICNGCFLLLLLTGHVLSQSIFELSEVRLYTEAGIIFGGAVEVLTPNGWERVCYNGFDINMADYVCHKRGFDEGAMSVRPLASLGQLVNPIPSISCQFSTVDGDGPVQCQYASACSDHAVVICNYPGYLGCYRHTRNNPSLNEAVFAYHNMTVQFCLSLCHENGYPYAGVSFGQECHCEAHGIDASSRLGNGDCYLPCVGDPLQNCGGGTAAGVYDSRLGSCNEVYTDAEGAITSPGFPGEYSNDEHCTWTINVANAANITVHVWSIALYNGDKLKVANPSIGEYISFTGGPSVSSVQFDSSGRPLEPSLVFTFDGNMVKIEFNSSLSSLGGQGVVLTFSSEVEQTEVVTTDPPVQLNMTETIMTSQVTNASRDVITSRPFSTTSPTRPITKQTHISTQHTVDDQSATTPINFTVGGTVPITTDAEGALSATPRSVTIINEELPSSRSLAVIVAIAVGVILIILLILTVIVLFKTSSKKDSNRTRARGKNNGAITNAAYGISDANDGQTDSGIYDPGYETADAVDEPIYLSIRNDPRADRSEFHRGRVAASRNDSARTTKTDHDYQSVNGVSRRNTERSYISIYPDNTSVFASVSPTGTTSPEKTPPNTTETSEDGYMVPTPKSSTQSKLTRL